MLIENFKDFDGRKIEDVANYVRSHINGIDECRILVGSDSQVYRTYTTYAVAICMYNVGNGAHIIYSREKDEGIEKDLASRLWGEVERTINVADYLRTRVIGVEIDTHFDVNPSDQFASNIIYKAAIGYANGAGFNFNVKPNSFAATCAADKLC